MSHHIALMEAGQLVAFETPEQMFRSGRIDRVFGVRGHRDEAGEYYFTPANK